jgi:hypothetical protein
MKQTFIGLIMALTAQSVFAFSNVSNCYIPFTTKLGLNVDEKAEFLFSFRNKETLANSIIELKRVNDKFARISGELQKIALYEIDDIDVIGKLDTPLDHKDVDTLYIYEGVMGECKIALATKEPFRDNILANQLIVADAVLNVNDAQRVLADHYLFDLQNLSITIKGHSEAPDIEILKIIEEE